MTTRKTKAEVEQRIDELAEGDSNDAEIEGLTDLALELAEEPATLRVKSLRPGRLGYIPVVPYAGDAGLDLAFTPEDGMSVPLRPGQLVMAQTGIALAIPEGYAGLVLPRSGLGKIGIRPRNTPGLIDSGYRGEVIVLLENAGSSNHAIAPGDRIAQLVIVPVLTPTVEIVAELDETERGEQGFGSSGV